MQCKVLKYQHPEGKTAQIEAEINHWLAQGWKIASTSVDKLSYLYIFLTK